MPHGDDFTKTDRGTRKEVNYVQHKGTQFQKILYKDDPMTFITKDLWTDEDSKIMLFACMYPLVQVKKKNDELFPKNLNPLIDIKKGQAKEDAWDKHFKIKPNEESLHKKFIRDLGILKEMDYVQKIGRRS